jgi:hypothetical protein
MKEVRTGPLEASQGICYQFNTSVSRGREGLITILVPSFLVIALLFVVSFLFLASFPREMYFFDGLKWGRVF